MHYGYIENKKILIQIINIISSEVLKALYPKKTLFNKEMIGRSNTL